MRTSVVGVQSRTAMGGILLAAYISQPIYTHDCTDLRSLTRSGMKQNYIMLWCHNWDIES